MFERLDAYIAENIENNIIPGAVLLLAQNGRVLHEKAYGYAQKLKLTEEKILVTSLIPMSTKHLFDLASLTKVLATTFAIMLLLDQGKLQIDDPIKNYLPEFDNRDKNGITIRLLLSHASGFTPWKPIYCHVNSEQEALKFISELPLEYEPGSQRKYSDINFIILQCLIERISNQKLDEFLQEYLYEKLNLTDILFRPKNKKEKIVSTSHGNPFEYKMIADDSFGYKCEEKIADFTGWRDYTLNGEVNDGNAYHVFSEVSGHAGLFSTAADANMLMQVLLNKGWFNSNQILKQETVEMFTTMNDYKHGLGWAMSAGNEIADLPLGEFAKSPFAEGVFGHTGFTGTFVLAIPSKKISLVLLTNVQNLGVNKDGYYNKLNDFRKDVLNLAIKICLKNSSYEYDGLLFATNPHLATVNHENNPSNLDAVPAILHV